MLAVSRPARPEFARGRATPGDGHGTTNGDRDATSAPPPRRHQRPTRLRPRWRRCPRRAVLHRMPTVPAARDRLGRAVAVPVLRLGGLLEHLTTAARQSPLRRNRPPDRQAPARQPTPRWCYVDERTVSPG